MKGQYVKILTHDDAKHLENNINKFIEQTEDKVIDINFSTAKGYRFQYSALLLLKKGEINNGNCIVEIPDIAQDLPTDDPDFNVTAPDIEYD